MPHVIHHLYALQLRVEVERLLHLLHHQLPGKGAHAAGGVNNKNDIFAVHRNAAYGIVQRAALVGRQQPFHFLSQALLGAHQPGFHRLAGLQICFCCQKLGCKAGPFSLKSCQHLAGGGLAVFLTEQLPAHLGGFSGQLQNLPLQCAYLLVQLVCRLGENDRLKHSGQHQHEYDRPKAAADHIQQGEVHAFTLDSAADAHFFCTSSLSGPVFCRAHEGAA